MSIFHATELDVRNQRTQKIVRIGFLVMTLMLVIPVLIIIGLLIVRGGPAISWVFLTEFPRNGMTEGGIFPALAGTVFLVGLALLFSLPLGVAAAIYLSEYAKEN